MRSVPVSRVQFASQAVRLTRPLGRAELAIAAVRRAVVSNDDVHLYLRVDNAAGSLPAFRNPPRWAIALYSQDLSGNPSAPLALQGFYGAPLRVAMTRLVARWSSSDRFAAFQASLSAPDTWTFLHDIGATPPPAWDPSTGHVEMTVPLEELATGPVGFGLSVSLLAGFLVEDSQRGTWLDYDLIGISYRLLRPDKTDGPPGQA